MFLDRGFFHIEDRGEEIPLTAQPLGEDDWLALTDAHEMEDHIDDVLHEKMTRRTVVALVREGLEGVRKNQKDSNGLALAVYERLNFDGQPIKSVASEFGIKDHLVALLYHSFAAQIESLIGGKHGGGGENAFARAWRLFSHQDEIDLRNKK